MSTTPETAPETPRVARLGDTVRRMDRDGLWQVIGIQAGRAFLSPEAARPEWASLSDLVVTRGTA